MATFTAGSSVILLIQLLGTIWVKKDTGGGGGEGGGLPYKTATGKLSSQSIHLYVLKQQYFEYSDLKYTLHFIGTPKSCSTSLFPFQRTVEHYGD